MPAHKTLFGSLAIDIIEASGRKVSEVAALVPNTPANQFHRWKRGAWGYIEDRKLERLIRAITDDPLLQQNLAIAYLWDLLPVSFRPLVEITPRGEVRAS